MSNFIAGAKKPTTKAAWLPSRRSATWWQLHKMRGVPASNPTVSPVDPDSFSSWSRIVNANVVAAAGQPIAIEATLRDDATDRRVLVQWRERYFGLWIPRTARIELRELG